MTVSTKIRQGQVIKKLKRIGLKTIPTIISCIMLNINQGNKSLYVNADKKYVNILRPNISKPKNIKRILYTINGKKL